MNNVVDISNLDIGYGSRCVIRNVNFSLKQGEMVGIIGRNGAGKSTLLKTIRGLFGKSKITAGGQKALPEKITNPVFR